MSIIITMIGCYVYGVISTTAALAEVWSLAAVSLDRALAIYHPLNPYKRFTKSQVIVAIYIYRIYDSPLISLTQFMITPSQFFHIK